VFADEGLDVRDLPVGPPGKAEVRSRAVRFVLPYNLKAGVYSVYVSVGSRTGTPRLALPLPDHDSQRRYRLGAMEVTPKPQQ
jgi:hypothetical protein